MPKYKLRKAPKKELYWVISPEGRHLSKDPLPLDRAKAQLKAVYASLPKPPPATRGGQNGVPTFQQWLELNEFPSQIGVGASTKVGNNTFQATLLPTDEIVIDEAKYNQYMKGLLSQEKYENAYKKRGQTPPKPYEEYKREFEDLQRRRATTNVSAGERTDIELQRLNIQNQLYDEYLKEFPQMEEVMCPYNMAGDTVKTRMTKEDCNKAFSAWEAKAHPDRATFYRPAVGAVAQATQLLSQYAPGVPQPLREFGTAVGEWAEQTNNPVMSGGKKDKWIQRVVRKRGFKEGAFTRQALQHNMTPLQFADEVMANPKKYTKRTFHRALFVKNVVGAGFFGDLWDAGKQAVSNVITKVQEAVRSKVIRNDYPPYVRNLLAEIGNLPIKEISVRRDPIQGTINKALNFITRGKWEEVRQKYAYDKLFHLGIEVVVHLPNTDATRRYTIEKNEVISIAPAKATTNETESVAVPMNGGGQTINGLLKGGQAVLGDKFFTYDAFQNNCQDFIVALLLGSGLGTPSIYQFVKQPVDKLLAELPSYTAPVARAITDTAGAIDTVLYGRGGGNPSSAFAKQMKRLGVSPIEYLDVAKDKAREQGLAYNMLSFSSDDKHKLQMPNQDGKIIRFGAVGKGDFILYTLTNNPEADKHRERYLARATKIKGDWKSDPYSPNSLAISILWTGKRTR